MPEPAGRLSQRDIVVLPLLSLLTCIGLFAIAEITARAGWPEVKSDSCLIADPVLGHRPKPNCVSRNKALEGPWVENRYNACGYRTDQDCGPRKPGVRRVDLMVSSTSQGYLVPYDGTVAGSLAASLAKQCRQDVQVENMGLVGYQGKVIAAQVKEAVALQPDAIVFLITPFDLDEPEEPAAEARPAAPTPQNEELLHRLREMAGESRAVSLAQHFMFVDSERFATLYLSYGDRADFLRPPFSAAWQKRLAHFDELLTRIKAEADLASIPLVLAYVPSRAQAVFLASTSRPAGVDPFAFGRALGDLAHKHGIGYVDMSDIFATMPNIGSLFYPQDGHLDAEGQPLVGRALASKVVASSEAFQTCAQLTSNR